MYVVGETNQALLAPDPTPVSHGYTIVSVDDHLVEPPDMFVGRVPQRFADLMPKVVEDERGNQIWEFDGQRFTQVGMNAVAGRRREAWSLEPTRFEDMRRGCWDIHERIRDMDIGGIRASLNFPSQITGFCGRVYSMCSDSDLGFAVTQAWNDWMFDAWYSPYPDRIIPLAITWMTDAEKGAAEIRRNAARGIRAITLPERPHRIGLPSLFSGHWDPIIEACVDTDTVICLHVGSSGVQDMPPGAPSLQLGATLFGQLSLTACTEWLWSGYAVRYPTLKIAMSEGGIGWVAMLLDRLDNLVDRSGYGMGWPLRPAEVLRRNFWFCSLDDPSTIDTWERIGVDRIMAEVDYPHGDSTWPNTQQVIHDAWGHLPRPILDRFTYLNAAELFGLNL
jgi:predicted TIM-barrel fold metal-dependent hydrolase